MFVVLIAFVCIIIVYIYQKKTYWTRRNVLGPSPLPIFGNMLNFLRKKQHYGEVYDDIYRWVSSANAFIDRKFRLWISTANLSAKLSSYDNRWQVRLFTPIIIFHFANRNFFVYGKNSSFSLEFLNITTISNSYFVHPENTRTYPM